MASTYSDHWGYRLGRASVRAVRQLRMWVRYLALVMQRKGIPQGVAQVLAWIVAIAVVGVDFYVLFWLTVLVFVVVCAVLTMVNLKSADSEDWILKEEEDHRDGPFYDPINFSDDPDPRFDDHRHQR